MTAHHPESRHLSLWICFWIRVILFDSEIAHKGSKAPLNVMRRSFIHFRPCSKVKIWLFKGKVKELLTSCVNKTPVHRLWSGSGASSAQMTGALGLMSGLPRPSLQTCRSPLPWMSHSFQPSSAHYITVSRFSLTRKDERTHTDPVKVTWPFSVCRLMSVTTMTEGSNCSASILCVAV